MSSCPQSGWSWRGLVSATAASRPQPLKSSRRCTQKPDTDKTPARWSHRCIFGMQPITSEPHPMKLRSAPRMVLLLLCLMYFITYLDRVDVGTAAAGFSKEFGLNNTQIGLVFSAFAYPYLLFQIIGGWISDRVGARRTLIACGIIWASATILSGLAGGLTSLLLARILLGFGEGATFPAPTLAM